MDNRPIGVFDSGLGGLTAVRELRRILPGEDIIFFGDTGRVPYGSRSPHIIKEYAKQYDLFTFVYEPKENRVIFNFTDKEVEEWMI